MNILDSTLPLIVVNCVKTTIKTKMNVKSTILLALLTLSANIFLAQDDTIRYQDEVYVDFIESVSFHQTGLPTSYPAIQLDRGTLSLSFDDMGGSFYDYRYYVQHCDKDWNPSDIDELVFLDGFNGELILDYDMAQNTFVDYTNYQLRIPNRDVRFKISGNYLLIINDENDLPLITRRFIVYDPKVTVISHVRRAPEVEFINSYQGVNFELLDKKRVVRNPKEEIYASIVQNNRWFEAKNNLKPSGILGDKIIFNNRIAYSFPGLKEHRSFDIRTLEAATRNVHSIDLESNGTKAILELSKNRYYGNYTLENDANGSFVLSNANGMEDRITGDYVDVYFTLQTMEVYDRDVYILGQFNNWTPQPKYKMEYDYDRNLYTNNLFFKQGYYDYFYGTLDGEGLVSTELLEGNSSQTENDYMVIIYQRAYTEIYDEVIGVALINTTTN